MRCTLQLALHFFDGFGRSSIGCSPWCKYYVHQLNLNGLKCLACLMKIPSNRNVARFKITILEQRKSGQIHLSLKCLTPIRTTESQFHVVVRHLLITFSLGLIVRQWRIEKHHDQNMPRQWHVVIGLDFKLMTRVGHPSPWSNGRLSK